MVDDEIDAQAEEDLLRGETIALPLAFVALVVVFGGLLAAVLPLALAAGQRRRRARRARRWPRPPATSPCTRSTSSRCSASALGIDYGLIVVSRFREERAAGRTVAGAIDRTIATAGRTVAYSGLTVAVAAGRAARVRLQRAALAGRRRHRRRARRRARRADACCRRCSRSSGTASARPAAARGPASFWHIAGWVRRRAVPVVVVVGVGLVVAALPFLHARFENPDARSLPRSSDGPPARGGARALPRRPAPTRSRCSP